MGFETIEMLLGITPSIILGDFRWQKVAWDRSVPFVIIIIKVPRPLQIIGILIFFDLRSKRWLGLTYLISSLFHPSLTPISR